MTSCVLGQTQSWSSLKQVKLCSYSSRRAAERSAWSRTLSISYFNKDMQFQNQMASNQLYKFLICSCTFFLNCCIFKIKDPQCKPSSISFIYYWFGSYIICSSRSCECCSAKRRKMMEQMTDFMEHFRISFFILSLLSSLAFIASQNQPMRHTISKFFSQSAIFVFILRNSYSYFLFSCTICPLSANTTQK